MCRYGKEHDCQGGVQGKDLRGKQALQSAATDREAGAHLDLVLGGDLVQQLGHLLLRLGGARIVVHLRQGQSPSVSADTPVKSRQHMQEDGGRGSREREAYK